MTMAPNAEQLILDAMGRVEDKVDLLTSRLDVHIATCTGTHLHLSDRLKRSSERAAKLSDAVESVKDAAREQQISMLEDALEKTNPDIPLPRKSDAPKAQITVARSQAVAAVVVALIGLMGIAVTTTATIYLATQGRIAAAHSEAKP